jgi:O-succinylbenzoic acid--CoA ligase
MNPLCLIEESAKNFGDSVALYDLSSERKVRYRELPDFLRLVTKSASEWGASPLVTVMPTSFDHVSLILAGCLAGRPVAPLSPRLPRMEILRRAAFVRAQGIYGVSRFEKRDSLRWELKDVGTLLYTSGSSGTPKVLAHRWGAHMASAAGAEERIPLAPGCGWLLSLPLHHVSGISVLIRCLASGATIVIPDPSLPLEAQISNQAITHLSVVALQLERLLVAQASLHRLNAVLAGGGPISASLVHRSIESGVPLHLTYGMTETASQITTTEKLTTCPSPIHAGIPLPGREIRLSASGEVQVRGGILATGVLNSSGCLDPIADSSGWATTGDLGILNENNELILLGRRDRMIISGGENIHPEAIEAILSAVPSVVRVAVVGIAHSFYGMRPVAFVAGDVEAEHLRDFLAERVEKFAIPDFFIPWPDTIPIDDAKIDYTELARLAAIMTH